MKALYTSRELVMTAPNMLADSAVFGVGESSSDYTEYILGLHNTIRSVCLFSDFTVKARKAMESNAERQHIRASV